MTTCFTATPGVDVITTTADIPALGSLAINAFVLHGAEPVLVDTGTVGGSADFCSSHLPPAPGAMLGVFVDSLAMTPAADRFVGPDQAALEAMLAGIVDVPASSAG